MSESGPSRPRLPRGRGAASLAVTAILLAHYLLAIGGVWNKSVTYDETAHVTAGYAYWRFGDYRLQPENGNVPQRLAALPLALFGGFAFPDRDQPAWRTSDMWALGDQFLHGVGNDTTALLRRSRSVMALLGVALCLTVYAWGRSLQGPAAGLVALVLCAFSPLVLANGPLATSDMSATLFFTLAVWTLWRMLDTLTTARVLACAAALAGLALSKTSAVLILPMIGLLVPLALLRGLPLRVALPGRPAVVLTRARHRLAAAAGALLVCLLAAWGAVWAAYGFRYHPAPPAEQARFERYQFIGAPVRTLADAAARAGVPGRAIAGAGRHRLLPEAFLYGTAFVFAAAHHYGFLNGEISTEGWLSFFPYCFLVKSTLPLLLLIATALAYSLASPLRLFPGKAGKSACPPLNKGGQGGLDPAGHPPLPPFPNLRISDTAPLWVLLAVYWAALLASTISIGARHLLPVYPATFVLLGGWAARLPRGRLRWLLALLLCWHAAEAVRGFPHYLAYFNQITGRRHAYRHLVDSSLDWGQDLPGLKVWLDRRLAGEPRPRVYLSYFGTGSPAAYNIAAEPLEFEERARLGLPQTPEAGVYCVSATNLQGVYHPVRGRWNSRYEEAYRELRRAGAGADATRLDEGKVGWLRDEAGRLDAARKFQELSTARLMAFLRAREPEGGAGFSILCYDVSGDDVARALEGPAPGG